MAEETWYIRARGRVTGPFDRAQLENLRNRGQFARFHEISQDRQTWVSAATLDMFAQAVVAPAASAVAPTASAVAPEPDSYHITPASQPAPAENIAWFYARDGVSAGPVSTAELQHLADCGDINAGTLVWKEGMSGWAPCREAVALTFKRLDGSVPQGMDVAPSAAYANVSTPDGGYSRQPPGAGSFPETSGLAVASLILGLVWLCGLGSLLATIFGAVALNQINRSQGALTGRGMAVAGLILGILGLVIAVLAQLASPTWP